MIYDRYYHASSKQYQFIMSHHIKCFKERKTSIIITTYSSLCQVSYISSLCLVVLFPRCARSVIVPPSALAKRPGYSPCLGVHHPVTGIPTRMTWHFLDPGFRDSDLFLHGWYWNPGWEVDVIPMSIFHVFLLNDFFWVGFVKGLFGCLGCLLISTDSLGTLWGDVGSLHSLHLMVTLFTD